MAANADEGESTAVVLHHVSESESEFPKPPPLDDSPLYRRQWGLYMLVTHNFMVSNSRKSKKHFAKFISEYNAHKDVINLTPEEFTALKELHAMWISVTDDSSLPYYYAMKDKHAILNGRLLCGLSGPKNELYVKYVLNFQKWRTTALVPHYHINRFLSYEASKAEKLLENSNDNEGAGGKASSEEQQSKEREDDDGGESKAEKQPPTDSEGNDGGESRTWKQASTNSEGDDGGESRAGEPASNDCEGIDGGESRAGEQTSCEDHEPAGDKLNDEEDSSEDTEGVKSESDPGGNVGK